jgi:hypothetical protein
VLTIMAGVERLLFRRRRKLAIRTMSMLDVNGSRGERKFNTRLGHLLHAPLGLTVTSARLAVCG